MAKYLILAEKKSLAEKIAKGFGKVEPSRTCFRAFDEELGEADVFYLFGPQKRKQTVS